MKTEPRPAEVRLPHLQIERRSATAHVIERLSSTGYQIDAEKWIRLRDAGLISDVADTAEDERRAIGRARRLLDVESKLVPTRDTDALCYYLVAAGIDGVPSAPVARHI